MEWRMLNETSLVASFNTRHSPFFLRPSSFALRPSSRHSFQNWPDPRFRHAHGAEGLNLLHGPVVVRAAGDELAAEAGHVGEALTRIGIDVGMEDLDGVDAGV